MDDAALVFVVLVALGFDYVNGFHDAANSIATVVSTRVLSPRLAVMWAAAFNFIAFLFFGTHVASTIAKDVVVQDVLTIGVIFAGLVGRHRVGPHHLLPGAAHQLVARPGGRHGRRRGGQGRVRRPGQRGHPQDRRCSSSSRR